MKAPDPIRRAIDAAEEWLSREEQAEALAALEKMERSCAYLCQLADAVERHELEENWATDAALRLACHAVLGDVEARRELDTNPAWAVGAPE